MDCFVASLLAMTSTVQLHTQLSSPAKAGDPVRRGFSVLSSASLEYWVARSSRAMTTGYIFAFSRRNATEVFKIIRPQKRGRRECRVRAAPAVSCARCTTKCAHEHTGSAETLRHSLRNGFTAYIVLSPENGSFASVGTQGCGPPGNLTPAPRRQDHTTSPYAPAPFVKAPSRPPQPAQRS